jgi:hypothetical protein
MKYEDMFIEPEGYKLIPDFKLNEETKYNLDENRPEVKIVERLFNTNIGGEGLLLMEILKRMRPLCENYKLDPILDFDLEDGKSYTHRLDLLHRDLLEKSEYDKKAINAAFEKIGNVADLIRLVDKAIPVTHPEISIMDYEQLRVNVFQKGYLSYLWGIEKLFVIDDQVSIHPTIAPILWSEFLRRFLMRYILHFDHDRLYSYRNYLQ